MSNEYLSREFVDDAASCLAFARNRPQLLGFDTFLIVFNLLYMCANVDTKQLKTRRKVNFMYINSGKFVREMK